MATSTQVPIFNSDPNIQAQAALIQQRQALAQKLLEEGLKPIETNNRTVGGVGYRVSPVEGLAKMVQAYVGRKGMSDATQEQAGLAAQAYAAALKANQPGGGTASYSPDQVSSAMDSAIPQSPGGGPPSPQDIAKALGGQAPANQPPANPRNPLGMPAELITGYQAGMIPKEVYESQAALYKPTDATLTARQGGMDPMAANRASFAKANTDPKILAMRQAGMNDEQINQAISGEADKARLIEGRAGQSLYSLGGNGQAPQLRAVAPDPGNNMQFGVGQNGQVSAQPVPGSVPNKSAMTGGAGYAGARGTALGGVHNVQTESGATVPVFGDQLPGAQPGSNGSFRGDPNAVAQQISMIKDPQERANAQAAFEEQMRREGGPLKLGQGTAAKAMQEDAGKSIAALPQQVTQTKQTVVGLENALKTLENLKSGPGVSKTVNALAMVNNMGIPLMAGDTNGYQTLKKFLENAASSAGAATGATRTDAQFEQFRSGQPNAETMNPKALEGAIRYVLSQQDAALHSGNYVLQQAGNDPGKFQSARQEWSKQYNPRYFEVQRLAPQEQKAAVQSMSPADAAAFLQWRKSHKVQ
jgi:hypothetical protein